MIGLSSSYFAFRGKSISDSVRRVFELGFGTAELGAAHSFEEGVWETLKGIKREFSDKTFTVHGLFPPLREKLWFNPCLGLTEQNVEITDGLFRAAEIAEAKVVGVHPGFLNELGFSFDKTRGFDVITVGKPLPPAECWQNFMKWLSYADSCARDTGVRLALENIHGSEANPVLFSAEDFQKVFDKFPRIGLLLDYGHALFEGLAGSFISAFAPRILEVHMHWSRPRSREQEKDEHAPITSLEQLEPFRKIPKFRKIPVIFEHGTNVSEKQVLAEKKLLEEFEETL